MTSNLCKLLLIQEFNLVLINNNLNLVISNQTSIIPSFSIKGLVPNQTSVYQASIFSFNLKGRSEAVVLPKITIDAEENCLILVQSSSLLNLCWLLKMFMATFSAFLNIG